MLATLSLAFVACSDPGSAVVPPDRSPLAVVSAHHAATDAGLEILQAGGTAADAAVAVAAVLSVVEPWFSSVLGGGTWALYFDADTGRVTSLDGVGPVGSLASVADYAARARLPGMHQAVVPGAWDGWMLWLEAYGRLPLSEVLAPAVALARDGYEVSTEMAQWLERGRDWVLAQPATAAIYAPEGVLLAAGDTAYQLDMAATLEDLAAAFDEAADDGRAAAVQAARDRFYRGAFAQAIVEFSDAAGGYFTLDDLTGFQARIVDPVSIVYRDDVEVFQNPPNSQGITMLLALNVLAGFDLAALEPDDPDAVHLQVEALKLAFADRHHHVGDPERVTVPVEALLSTEHAERQRARIALDAVLSWPIDDVLPPSSTAQADWRPAAVAPRAFEDATTAAQQASKHPPTGTTTFHVIDGEGNAAAVTTSLGAQFYVVGDTGIHINNRMRFIALDDDDPNRLTPGYKVRHTSNPYLVLRAGRPLLLGGNTGADSQVQGQLQQFVSVIDFGLDPLRAIARTRFLTTAFPATTYPYQVGNELLIEAGADPELVAALALRGHRVRVGPGVYGVANMLLLVADGTDAVAAAEPRSTTSKGVVVTPSRGSR